MVYIYQLSMRTHRFVLDLFSDKPLGDGCLGGPGIVGGRLRVGGGGGWETRIGLGPNLLSCPPSWVGGGGGSGREEIRPLSVASPLAGPGGGGRGLELMGVVLVGGGGGLRPPKEAAGDGLGLFCDGGTRVGGGGGADRGIVGLTLLFGLLAGKDCWGGEGARTGGGGGLAVDSPGVVLDGGGGGTAFVVFAGFGRTKFGEDGGLFIDSPLVFLLMLPVGGGTGGFRPGGGVGRFRPGVGGGAGRLRPEPGGGVGGFRP